ncbi:MAG: DUF2111 domain-containing protein [Methanosarcinaceae archaeon]|nr:DUF2111 domain-containing protein [Methanosarcinaceae archaeon]
MKDITISADSIGSDLEPIVKAIHELTGLPTTARSLNKIGIRMEKGKLQDAEYTGPVLEEVLRTNKTTRRVPNEGVYKGMPVVVSPIRNEDGEVICTIGVVDIVGAIDISCTFSEYPGIIAEVEAAKKRN